MLPVPLHTDASVVLHKFDTPEGKHAFWHSSAHLMAEALEALYPGIKFGIGPAIENGFYYDVDPGDGVVITEADLPRIEEKMVELSRKNSAYEREEIGKEMMYSSFSVQKDDEYKVELIEDLAGWYHYPLQTGKFYRSLPWSAFSGYKLYKGH